MISVSGNKWSERKLNNRIIEKISIDNNLSYDLSKLILDRNYSLDEIKGNIIQIRSTCQDFGIITIIISLYPISERVTFF